MYKNIIIIFVFLVASIRLNAQDFHMSMYDAAPLFLNPAMTGVFEADWRIHAQYRTQWRAINFKPYTTGLISFDMPYKKWGFGAQISNFRAGIGNYNVLQGLGSASYTTPIDKKKFHNVSFGLQAGITQKSIEYQLHTFDNQYTSANGGGFDIDLNNGESFNAQASITPVANFGVLYYYAKQQSKLNPFIGVSAFNLLRPTETFLNANNKLPMRYYIHFGSRINITETFYIIPKILIMNQNKFNEQTLAAEAGYFIKSAELYLLGGLIYRVKDASIITIGARKDNYIARFSYDINLSTLTPVSNGRGAFEISFTYMKSKPIAPKEKICPRL